MTTSLTAQDRFRVRNGILNKYSRVSIRPNGLFQHPTEITGLVALNYDRHFLEEIPVRPVWTLAAVAVWTP